MMALAPGRLRAQSSPFWATALSRMDKGAASVVTGLHGLVQRSPQLKDHIWFGSGWRTGSVEHGSGRAIDIILTADTGRMPNPDEADTGRMPNPAERAAGLALINWLIQNAKTLRIQWILFSRDGKPRTESWNADRGTWKALKNRGSVSANHVDHVHVYFKPGAAWPAAFNTASIGGAPAPKPAPPKPAPPKQSGTLREDKPPRKYVARVKQLQVGLNRVFPRYSKLKADGYFGPATTRVVKEFQRRHGKGLAVDGIVGPATTAALATYGIRF